MPPITLNHAQGRAEELPLVCMCCGQSAAGFWNSIFPKTPLVTFLAVPMGLLPLMMWALFPKKRILVRAPLCALHRNHWRWRTVLLFLGLLVNVVLAILVVTAFLLPESVRNTSHDQPKLWLGAFVAVGGVLPLILVMAAVCLEITAIHVTKITRNTITLIDVPVEFVEAVRVRRGDHESPSATPADPLPQVTEN